MFRHKQQLNRQQRLIKYRKNNSKKKTQCCKLCIRYARIIRKTWFLRHVFEYAENEGCIEAERSLILTFG